MKDAVNEKDETENGKGNKRAKQRMKDAVNEKVVKMENDIHHKVSDDMDNRIKMMVRQEKKGKGQVKGDKKWKREREKNLDDGKMTGEKTGEIGKVEEETMKEVKAAATRDHSSEHPDQHDAI